jgi:hypothetical protein
MTVTHQTTKACQHLLSIALLIQTRILPWNIDVWPVGADGMKAHQSPTTILLFHFLITNPRMIRETSSLWDEGHSQVTISHIMKHLVSLRVPRIVRHLQVLILAYEESVGHPPILLGSSTLMHLMNNCISTQSNMPEHGHMTMKLMHTLPQIFTLCLTWTIPSGILMMNPKMIVTPLVNLKITVSPTRRP